MTNAERMSKRLNGRLTDVKSGTLRFWGEWFGRPYDNVHRLISCAADGDMLRLHFSEGELLSISNPRWMIANRLIFRISGAAQVRWEWFYYGRPKIEANLYFMEFERYIK